MFKVILLMYAMAVNCYAMKDEAPNDGGENRESKSVCPRNVEPEISPAYLGISEIRSEE